MFRKLRFQRIANRNVWWVQAFTFANGQEIGDLCTLATIVGNNFYNGPATVRLDDHLYSIQAEYSNRVHGCTYKSSSGDN